MELILVLLSKCFIYEIVFNYLKVIIKFTYLLSQKKRRDGSFEVNNLPPGSYIIDVTNPNYVFEPIRVDINSKGKIRARKVNLIQTNIVQQVGYPIRLKPKMPFKYFQMRESWRLTDFLFNPMVLMMVVPLLLIMGLSKTVNMKEAETQKELQNLQMPKYDVPELSEMMTSFFNKGVSKNSNQTVTEKIKAKSSKKKKYLTKQLDVIQY